MSGATAILIFVQHLWGIGHVSRSFAIAGACTEAGARVCVVLGGPPTGLPVPEGVETVQLPPIRAADETYRALIDETGQPASQCLWAARRDRLLTTLDVFRPSHVITEHFPFGRRKQRPEFMALIDRARSMDPRPRIIASVRDIVEDPGDARRRAAQIALAACFFDAILVHGDPRLIRLEESLPHIQAIRGRLIYTGYVHRPAPPPAAQRRGIIVSAGGGRDAAPLIEAVLELHRRGLAGPEPWTLVTGPAAPLPPMDIVSPTLTILPQAPDLPARLARAALSISRAGYNTVAEGLATGVPMILIPRTDQGEEREQTLRAEALSARGLAAILEERSRRGEPPLSARLAQATRAGSRGPSRHGRRDHAFEGHPHGMGGSGLLRCAGNTGTDSPQQDGPQLDGAAWTADRLLRGP